MSFLSLVGVEFKKIKRSKIFLILFAATVILWIPSIQALPTAASEHMP